MANTKKFESLQLKPNILKGITAMGYDNLNQVQDALLPLLCADPPSNIIMNSHLNEHKIIPFIIAMLKRIDSSQNFPQALCIASTNQMAKQIIEIGSKIAQYSAIEFECIDTGVSEARNPDKHIIVVAPEQLNRLISEELCNFATINVLMLIDTDEMFTDKSQLLCETIGKKLLETCQKIYLSPAVAEFARPIAKSAIIFDFLQVPGSMDKIIQFYVRCRDQEEKYQVIRNNFHLLSASSKAIIYCQNHETASWLAEKVKRDQPRLAFYSDEISVEDRAKGLKETKYNITITTDAMLPFFSFGYIAFVVNFDIPVQNGEADFDTYFSRISRMGRLGSGIVINLVDSDQSMETCQAIEKHFGKTIYSIDDEDLSDFEIIDINSKSADEIVVSFFQKIYCRNDPFKSLWSTKTYEELRLIRTDLYKGTLNKNTSRPSKFLEATVTALCEDPDRNLIAQGQAGTGKTTAMTFVMMSRIDKSKKYPQVLCLVPKFELADQTSYTASLAAWNARIWWYKANCYNSQHRRDMLRYQVIIGTPKNLIDMINAFDTEKISLLVLDDADHIISTPNRWNDCKYISEKLSPNCQIMLFSTAYSTLTMKNALNFVKDPILINLPRESELPQNITQFYVTYSNLEEKYHAIVKLFKAMFIFQGVIFCNTKETAIWLEKRLRDDGQSYMGVEVISDDTLNYDRSDILDWLCVKATNVLISSTSLHDVFSCRNVIIVNFNMPIDEFGEVEYRTYLQRISRTARFGRNGVAVNMIDENDDHEVVACRAIEQHFGKKLHYLNF